MKGARDADGVNHTLHPERTSKKNCRLATYSVEGYEWASEKKRHGVTRANWWYIWYLKIHLGKSREFLRITSSPEGGPKKYGKTHQRQVWMPCFNVSSHSPRKKSLFLAWLVTIKGFAHALEGHGKHLHQFLRYLLKPPQEIIWNHVIWQNPAPVGMIEIPWFMGSGILTNYISTTCSSG